MRVFLISAIAVAFMAGCEPSPKVKPAVDELSKNLSTPRQSGLGFDPSFIDPSVRPRDDFFQYANGSWVRDTVIPTGQKSVSMFSGLSELVDNRQLEILEQLQQSDQGVAEPNDQLLLNFYSAYIDQANIDVFTSYYLQSVFEDIDSIENSDQLLQLFIRLHRSGVNTPIKLGVEPDARNPSYHLLEVRQAGLGMPGRKFYIRDDAESQYIQDAYKNMLAQAFMLANMGGTDDEIDRVWSLETQLALAHWAHEDSLDRDKSYNLYSSDRTLELGQDINFKQLFELLESSGQRYIRVYQPSYLSRLSDLVKSTPLDDWKLYLKAQVLVSRMMHLSKPYQALSTEFFGGLLGLRHAMLSPERTAVRLINRFIGDAMAARYTEKFFSRDDKNRVYQIAEQVIATAVDDLETNEWMMPATAKRAQQKLTDMGIKIGYPNSLSTYPELSLSKRNRLENIVSVNEYKFDSQIAKLNRAVSADDWYASASSVYAFYNASSNEIVFPAAILVPPFFQANADDAANYGAIGTLIAHEVARAIDIQGSQLDGTGLQDNWWQDQDREAYLGLRSKLMKQYAQFELMPGTSLGELSNPDIAVSDLLGVELAFRAYKSLPYAVDDVVIDNFSSNERFFIAYAQAWRFKVKQDYLLRALPYIAMAPPNARVNISLANSRAFNRAYGVKKGDKMWVSPRSRSKLW